MLLLLLERVAEQAWADSWCNIRDDLKQIQFAQLSSRNETVWQVNRPSPQAIKRLKSLQIAMPVPVLKLV